MSNNILNERDIPEITLRYLLLNLNEKFNHTFQFPSDLIVEDALFCFRIRTTLLDETEYPYLLIKCDRCKIDLRIKIDYYIYTSKKTYIYIFGANYSYHSACRIDKNNCIEKYIKDKVWSLPSCDDYIIESIIE